MSLIKQLDRIEIALDKLVKGGSGSGNFGHSGRSGKVGGAGDGTWGTGQEALAQTKRDKEGKLHLADGSPLPSHIKYIPPAWKNVLVARHPDADLLAKGIDAKGRVQSLYSDNHKTRQAAVKFSRVNELRGELDRIKREVDSDVHSKDRETAENAAALRLIIHTGIRPGGEGNTLADKKAYGCTTLEGRHVKEVWGKVRLRFVGKKGVKLDIPVEDKTIAADLLKRRDTAGDKGRLFDTDANRLSGYTHSKDGGGFKTKDFRTAVGTNTAIEVMKKFKTPTDEKSYKKTVREVAKEVAERLGNTPTVALQSYIDPSVFSKWRKGL